MMTLPFNIAFGANGDYRLWTGEGWHHDANDKEHTWSSHCSHLTLPLPLPRVRAGATITLDMIPAGGPQDVFLYINGGFVTFWRVVNAGPFSAQVAQGALRPGENVVSIVCPKAICPKDMGIGDDMRPLGVAVRSLSLSE